MEINIEAILRLGELAYRCNLCRRCAQTCPLGLDNSVIARAIRALFSMEMGIAPTLLHERGTVLQLKTGSSTGMNRNAFLDNIEFIEEDIHERLGKKYKFPIDKKGADILLIHNAGEYLSWPDNPAAFAILFAEAGDWTMSSELAGYDGGTTASGNQAKKIALAHAGRPELGEEDSDWEWGPRSPGCGRVVRPAGGWRRSNLTRFATTFRLPRMTPVILSGLWAW